MMTESKLYSRSPRRREPISLQPADPVGEDGLAVIARAAAHGGSIAVDGTDGIWTYEDLLTSSAEMAKALLSGRSDLAEERVAYLVEPGGRFIATMWGIWRAGGVAVPLALSHPPPELDHVVVDSGASIVVVDPDLRNRIDEIATAHGAQVLEVTADHGRIEVNASKNSSTALPVVDESRRSLMIYTSGTTGRPKGAVHTHRGVRANIEILIDAWGWRADDRVLLVLPLHHVHGLINVVGCAMWAGARCDALARFDEVVTFRRISEGVLTVFMAVPTIYARLTAVWDGASDALRSRFSAGCRAMRLMVSGSAALPIPTLERWFDISGHTLLERYGMTELGMVLSNPLEGERRPGRVGHPLPGIEVRLVDEEGDLVPMGVPGEIEVRGPNVFLEYWARPDATERAFRDGWFRTGDTAVCENGTYRILGRNSVDILKVGGFKVSALEIEDVLRGHVGVADCAIVGIPDDDLGQRIAAAIVSVEGATVEANAIREWARHQLASYKVPHMVMEVESLPRNAMGKVIKPEVAGLFGSGVPRSSD